MVEIDPTTQPRDGAAPLGHVTPDDAAAGIVVAGHTQLLDNVCRRRTKLFVDLVFDWQAVAVPAKAALDIAALHGPVARHDVFDGRADQMTVMWQSGREGRTVVEDVGRVAGVLTHRALENSLAQPERENRVLCGDKRKFLRATLGHDTSSQGGSHTPQHRRAPRRHANGAHTSAATFGRRILNNPCIEDHPQNARNEHTAERSAGTDQRNSRARWVPPPSPRQSAPRAARVSAQQQPIRRARWVPPPSPRQSEPRAARVSAQQKPPALPQSAPARHRTPGAAHDRSWRAYRTCRSCR